MSEAINEPVSVETETAVNPVDAATYDYLAHSWLPGVDVSGAYAHRPTMVPVSVIPPDHLAYLAAIEANTTYLRRASSDDAVTWCFALLWI